MTKDFLLNPLNFKPNYKVIDGYTQSEYKELLRLGFWSQSPPLPPCPETYTYEGFSPEDLSPPRQPKTWFDKTEETLFNSNDLDRDYDREWISAKVQENQRRNELKRTSSLTDHIMCQNDRKRKAASASQYSGIPTKLPCTYPVYEKSWSVADHIGINSTQGLKNLEEEMECREKIPSSSAITLDHPVFAHITEQLKDTELTPKPKRQRQLPDDNLVSLGTEISGDINMDIADAAGLETGIFDERFALFSHSKHDTKISLKRTLRTNVANISILDLL